MRRLNCEICGDRVLEDPIRINVEGSIMFVCGSCASLGKRTESSLEPNSPGNSGDRSGKSRSGSHRSPPSYFVNPSEEGQLIEGYALILRQAREKIGITQEELGKKVNEKPSTLRLVERGTLRPSDSLTRKLEHYLKIDLQDPLVDEE